MNDGAHPLIRRVVQICADKGVREFIVAPGSRSAPLTIALSQHPLIRCRVVYDERSAGYIALGLAQQLRRAVGLVCTSGTAAVNFGPAVVEAFYQQVPLLVFTADRPPEWIDQQDNQAIHQAGLYAPHVRGSFVLPVDDGHPDTTWFAERVTAQAIELAQGWEPGPVHVDIPLREPLYEGGARGGGGARGEGRGGPHPRLDHEQRAIQVMGGEPRLDEAAWEVLLDAWRHAERKLIVAGLHAPDAHLSAALAVLNRAPSVAIFADVTANLDAAAAPLPHADLVLGTGDAATLETLAPDLVVNFGGQVTSKALKMLLRRHPPRQLWFVKPAGLAPDTYQHLSHVIPMRPATFFAELARRSKPETEGSTYGRIWRQLEIQAATASDEYMATVPFGEFLAIYRVLCFLPAGTRLQIGNSMPIRYVNLIGVAPGHTPSRIDANRGTSGIDGTVSTAVGAALAVDTLTTLIVGDLGFFYDRNGLWHRHLPPNLRIVLLNNHGGGIFDIIEGPDRLTRDEQETYFLTPQPLTARRTAEDHGLDYSIAHTDNDLTALLPVFFAAGSRPAILEIETTIEDNSAIYREFKTVLGALHLKEN